LRSQQRTPVLLRYGREIALVAKQVIDNEHTRFSDPLLNGFVSAKVLLVEWEGERTGYLYGIVCRG
jgi:hypothetical protein